VPPEDYPSALVPRHGFRLEGGGRRFDMAPSVAPTSVCIEGRKKNTREDLLRQVQNGVYIGRIWYTYPINGLRTGDFTATVVGDSYMIKDGKLTTPIKANVVRINDNIHQVLRNIMGITSKSRGTASWAEWPQGRGGQQVGGTEGAGDVGTAQPAAAELEGGDET